MRQWIAVLAVILNIFTVSAQIEWNDSTSTGWGEGSGVDINPNKPNGKVTQLSLSSTRLLLSGGETAQLMAIVNTDAANKTVTWSAADEAIATVSNNGLVTALTTGQTVVTATSVDGGLTAQCIVTVKNNAMTYVERIELERTELTMYVGETFLLHTTIWPENATNKSVTWRHDGSDYCPISIDEKGLITAIQPGISTISCYAGDGADVEAKCTVTVIDRKVTSLNLPATITLGINEMKTLEPTVTPEIKHRKFKWTVADPSIAYVTSSGRIVGIKSGTTIVTATAIDGTAVSASSTVKVSTSMSDWGYSGWVLERGKTGHAWTARSYSKEGYSTPPLDGSGRKWTASDYDDSDWDYTYGPVGWRNSPYGSSLSQWPQFDNASLSVRQQFYLPDVDGYDFSLYGCVVGGEYYINGKKYYVTDVNGWYYWGTYTVEINREDLNFGGVNTIAIVGHPVYDDRFFDFGLHYERSVPVTRIVLSKKSVTMPRLSTTQLTTIVKPNEVTRPTLKLTSSDEHVAIVKSDGTITSLSPGTTIISATSTDGGNVSASCKVTVTEEYGEQTEVYLTDADGEVKYYHQSKSLANPTDAQGNNYNEVAFDDATWSIARLPLANYAQETYTNAVMEELDHRYFTRQKIYLPKDIQGKYVVRIAATHSGSYYAYFNGVKIERYNGWFEHDDYDVPAELVNYDGDNVLSISFDNQNRSLYYKGAILLYKIKPVTTININKSTLTLDQQQEEILSWDVLPYEAYNRSVKWTSSAPTVATVSQYGEVKALDEGTATITASAVDGSGVSASCQVTVTNKMPVERWVKPLGTKQPWTARYVYCLEGETDYTNGPHSDNWGRSWTSPMYNDSSWGTITGPIGHYVGEHYETYWPDHNSRYYLREKFTLDDVSTFTDQKLYVLHDDGVKIWINDQLVRETGDGIMGEYIDIPSNTLVSGENTICIQVSEGDGGAYIDYGIKVMEKIEIVPVSAVTIDKPSLTLKINEKQQLTASLQPANVYYKDIAWESSDNTVAFVNEEGYVRALAPGTAVITVYNTHGKRYEAQCKVTVTNEIAPIQAGEWIITTGEDEEWPAKGLYARNGDVLYNAEPSADKNGNTWTSLEYDDSNWTDIIGPLDNHKGNWTEEYTRYYVRRYFTVGDLSDIKSVKLRIAHDDDAIVYINGIKVADCPGYTDYAYREFLIPTILFNKGQNVICVNIYQGYGGCNLYFGLQASDDDSAQKPVSSVEFTNGDVSISLGKSKKLSLTIEPDNVFSKEMYWSSSNPEVATVDSNGRVSAISLGTTVITAMPKFGNEGVMAQCKVTVIESSTSSNSLPDISFEFNFNAKDYDENEHCIANNDDAALAEYNLQLSENIPIYNAEEGSLDIQNICCGWIDKWERESRESGEYFYRSGQDDMTIICKVAPSYNDREDAADFISNRAGGYNYMLRIGLKSGNSWFFLHTGHAYSEDRSMHIPESDGQILAVRVNGNEDYILLENLTTHETLKVDNVNWGGGDNALKFFYNNGGEYYTGKFFWVYYSKEYLSDDDLQCVADYNDTYGTIVGDVNADGKVTVADLTTLINVLLINQQTTNKKADVNKDGYVNKDDVHALRELLLKKL